jgi:hypothetical protein
MNELHMSRKVTEFTLVIHVVALVVLVLLYTTGLWFSQSFEPMIGLALFGVFSMDAVFLFIGLSAVIPYLLFGTGLVFLIIFGFALPLLNPSTTVFGRYFLAHPLLTITYVAVVALGLIVYLSYLRQIEAELGLE